MTKEKESLQSKLAKRKYHIPNRFGHWFYYFLMFKIIGKKYKPHINIIDNINDCKGPCFLIWNHLSRIDHIYCCGAAYPRRINILAGYNEFFRSHLKMVFKLQQIIPKKNYVNDIPSLKAMQSIINQGGCVCFAPEGMSSIFGTNQPVCAGTGRFFKHYKIPVYFLEMRGQYLMNHKVCLDERYGDTFATLKILFTPEDLEKLSAEEIDEKMNLAFKHDEYKWNKEKRIPYKTNNGAADKIHDILFKCPKCGHEFEMSGHNDVIECKHCGNGAHINDYYDLIPFDENSKIPETITDWVNQERIDVINEIRKDSNYKFVEKVKLGKLPKYKTIKKLGTTVVCGEGEFYINHEGVHYRGTKDGEEFNFDQNYKVVFSLVITVATDHFGLYVDGEFYEFYPERPVVGKMIMLTEEMHRLHENYWKNFSWNDYMYK